MRASAAGPLPEGINTYLSAYFSSLFSIPPFSKTMRNFSKISLFALFLTGAVFSCSKNELDNAPASATSVQDGKPTSSTMLDAPSLGCVPAKATGSSITLNVCAGASGAPAGFSVQWMLKSEYTANGGWPVSSEVVATSSFCKASFSGVPGASGYNLASNGCIEVTIGDVLYDQVGASSPCENVPLQCGQEYVFRAFAHNVPQGKAKSDFSAPQTCATLACSGEVGCTLTQGYWKNHGPEGCASGNNTNDWKVTCLNLGSNPNPYSDTQLCTILNTPAKGNGLLSLAHQLIAAKLNLANGADGSVIMPSIEAADALIGKLVVGGDGYLAPSVTAALTTALDNYNSGATGPGHCPK